jgi:AraC-like DNA-binding protein
MLRGKKVLHDSATNTPLNYLPGESFILKADAEMVIDFPEANHANPTQCTALVIDNDYLKKQLTYINENFPKERELSDEWDMNIDQLWLQNDEKIAILGNRLIKIFSGNDPLKDILVDIKLKELMVSIMRLQNFNQLSDTQQNNHVNERFRAVIEYIRRNITSTFNTSELSKMACMSKSVFYRAFTNEFGLPPNQLILNEKIRFAKAMMQNEQVKIKEVCFAAGFSDPNYFSRIFKKIEGVSPLEYLQSTHLD